jgi:hypothetical protein
LTSQRFDELWKAYPKRFGKDSACRDWISEVTEENEDKVFACLQRYLRSAEVANGAVMNLGSTMRDTGWIVKCARDDWESEWPPASTVANGRTKQQLQADAWDRA